MGHTLVLEPTRDYDVFVGRQKRHSLSFEGYISACSAPIISINTEAPCLHELHPNLHREQVPHLQLQSACPHLLICPLPNVTLPDTALVAATRHYTNDLRDEPGCLDSQLQRDFSHSKWGRHGGAGPAMAMGTCDMRHKLVHLAAENTNWNPRWL